jgi:hypothetical protein
MALKCCALMMVLICASPCFLCAQGIAKDTIIEEKLMYHALRLNRQDQTILPWYASDPATAYDFVIRKTWQFWYTMRTDKNGLPYYMNHQVWRANDNDRRGIGGDQFAMALSSFNLLYGYTGNEQVKDEMKFIADYYLSHGMSAASAVWPNLPFPYNTLLYSGQYDGDMIIGKNYLQPDKAGSFGWELIKLYKTTAIEKVKKPADNRYLDAAVNIANTLAKKIQKGDSNHSPLPFKVNALESTPGSQLSNYTSNWSGTMDLFLGLIDLKIGDTSAYKKAFDLLLRWMKKYPLQTNKWGPFFEDVPGWSDTQINAVSFAQFMMNHPAYFPGWEQSVQKIFQWVYEKLGNSKWQKFGVTVVNEQTAYLVPGNSHSARQAAAAIQYAALSGKTDGMDNAIRQLNWATYMVDDDGKNCYPQDEVWMTDGYGDYIRHYLKAMAFYPALAPADQDHLLASTSIIQQISYQANHTIEYRSFDNNSTETFRLIQKPGAVKMNNRIIPETNSSKADGWFWKPLPNGGLLTIYHKSGNSIAIQN